MRLLALLALLAFTPTIAIASPLQSAARSTTVTDGDSTISVMAYNVENLFDTKHDEGKEDWTFLPLALKDASVREKCDQIKVFPWRMECLKLDWNDAVLEVKLQHVASAILSVNDGRGPDVLMLEEVENIGVLNMLNAHLAAAGYKTVILIEGNDDRGIDQAMLSRLPLLETPVNDPIPLGTDAAARKAPSKTRGLLHATFALPDGSPLTVFGVHFPSGDEAHDQRVQAIQFLNETRAQMPSDRMMIVGGDLNINAGEDDKFSMYSNVLADWKISHLIGCKGCEGTEYYKTKKEWSFLDALGFSDNLVSGSAWSVVTKSIQIPVFDDEMAKDDGTPQSFDGVKGVGVSDHFPIFAILKKN